MRTLRLVFALFAVLTLTRPGRCTELPPARQPIETVVDHYVDALLKKDGITAAPQADDATLVRRLTLDLVGRIPTSAEADAYVKSSDPKKRAKLVDRLMASPAFVRFQAAQFEAMLNSTTPGGDDQRGGLRKYLQSALKDGKSWDAIFRELIVPTDANAAEYLRARVRDLDRVTNDVSIAFFGVNVSCAQCHDHPLVADWKQDHFYGMKSFFARTYAAGEQLAERPAGLIKFKPRRGPERQAKMMFLTGTEVKTDTLRELTKEERKQEKQITEAAKKSKQAPPKPKFSARAKLVELALKPGPAQFFARALVNRIWHRFLGYGLVNPLDQMHSENPSSHPELMAWLARDTANHGYDLRRLMRGIVMSRTYSRSSRYPSEDQPVGKYFAVAQLKPMTPMQLATSLRIAATDPAVWAKLKPDEFEKRIENLENSARGFAAQIAQPTDDFQIGVSEALLFSNGERVAKELLTDGGGSLLGRVKTMKDPQAAIALLVQTAYTRPATDAELTALTEYVRRRHERAAAAYRQVLWALLTAAEFRFVY